MPRQTKPEFTLTRMVTNVVSDSPPKGATGGLEAPKVATIIIPPTCLRNLLYAGIGPNGSLLREEYMGRGFSAQFPDPHSAIALRREWTRDSAKCPAVATWSRFCSIS